MRANVLTAALADQQRVTEALGEHTLKLPDAQAVILDLVDREAGEATARRFVRIPISRISWTLPRNPHSLGRSG